MSQNPENKIGLVKSGVAAWVMYDFINSMLIINGSLYFSVWLTQDQQVSQFWYGVTFATSTLALLFFLPFMGAVIDRQRNGRRWLFWLSVSLASVSISISSLGHRPEAHLRIAGSLVAFGLINFTYQASLVAYNWLIVHLRGVKSVSDVRRVSGLGEGAGSVGSVVGAIVGAAILNVLLRNPQNTRIDLFCWVAIIFFILFTIDYGLLCQGIGLYGSETNLSNEPYGNLIRASFDAIKKPGRLRQFLIAFMLYADALLTVQLYLPIYMRERLLLTDNLSAIAFAVSLTAAAAGSWLFAWHTRRFKLKNVILVCLLVWSLTLIAFGLVERVRYFFILMVIAGTLFGILWSASRSYLIELSPRDALGRAFGISAVFERSASIVGPLLWGGIMFLPINLYWRYISAFACMALLLLIGAAILWQHKHDYSNVSLPS